MVIRRDVCARGKKYVEVEQLVAGRPALRHMEKHQMTPFMIIRDGCLLNQEKRVA